MKMQKLFALLVAFCSASLLIGCLGGGGQQQTGFKVRGENHVQVAGGGFKFLTLNSVRGQWLSDNGAASGNVRGFSPLLCPSPCRIVDGRAPARWEIVAGLPLECIGFREPLVRDVTVNSTQVSRCVVFGFIFPFASAPSSVDLQQPPATIEMTGSGLNNTYGMPRVEYVDQYTGDLLGSTTATAVNADGTWLQAPLPDLSLVYSGTYNVLISNVKSDGGQEYVGTSTVDCYGRDGVYEPPPDPDPCSCPPGMICMPCGPEN